MQFLAIIMNIRSENKQFKRSVGFDLFLVKIVFLILMQFCSLQPPVLIFTSMILISFFPRYQKERLGWLTFIKSERVECLAGSQVK